MLRKVLALMVAVVVAMLTVVPVVSAQESWGEGSLAGDLLGEVHIPPINAALPKRLGSFSFWRSEENFLEAMEQIYGNVSQLGLKVFLGELGGKN